MKSLHIHAIERWLMLTLVCLQSPSATLTLDDSSAARSTVAEWGRELQLRCPESGNSECCKQPVGLPTARRMGLEVHTAHTNAST